jgi:hypothetical protein
MIELYIYPPPQFPDRLWSHHNYLPIGTWALPKGINGQHVALATQPYLVTGSRILERYIFSSPHCQERLWSHQNYLHIGAGALLKGMRCAGYSNLHRSGVKNPRGIYLFYFTVSRKALEPSKLRIHWYRGSSQSDKAANK